MAARRMARHQAVSRCQREEGRREDRPMLTHRERGMTLCVTGAEKLDLYRQAAVLTGQMYLVAETSQSEMRRLSGLQEVILHQIAALDYVEGRL